MHRSDPLGQFEQLVLAAVMALREPAYGVTIHERVARVAGRPVTIGSVYSTLDRLESKQYVSSKLAEATAERGGRPKRYYRMLPAGERSLRDALETSRRIQHSVQNFWRLGRQR